MDLSRDVPRSPYEKLGGIVFLPRGIDKGRADLARTLGEYECRTGRSARLFESLGISSGASGCRPRRSCTAPTSINGRSRTGGGRRQHAFESEVVSRRCDSLTSPQIIAEHRIKAESDRRAGSLITEVETLAKL